MGLKLLVPFALLASVCALQKEPHYKVKCNDETMVIEVARQEGSIAYLENLKDFHDPLCKAQVEEKYLRFNLDLQDIFKCGTTKVRNLKQGYSNFHQMVIVEYEDGSKTSFEASCKSTTKKVNKREVLPAGFQEPEDLEITSNYTKEAPQPVLRVSVLQSGRVVTDELNVSPGTTLQMELGLDQYSAPVYGLLVSHMQVSDLKSQEETIIFNGCSVDPFLFENFYTTDGDVLRAKFRAFKFPDSTYVQFKGTVNVCLDKCRGVECSKNQIGYGRRRRAILHPELPPDPNKVFEITMSSIFKIESKGGLVSNKGKLAALNEPATVKMQDTTQQLKGKHEMKKQ
ncbi:uncharacterized protein LOC132198080 [Neocloeon triangulifer]|uniref:uncharacterized protein LOC132198080 n=1 Tax=Neocloeon triangulifer TaxID=2078957 RepID=UPI00286EBC1F|nr:uncharacterized protein LOC132198080 [Neocloeon triangulifer]